MSTNDIYVTELKIYLEILFKIWYIFIKLVCSKGGIYPPFF